MPTLTYDIASVNGLLVAEADGSNVLLANLDTLNTIYLANENSFGVGAGSADSVPLPPQASMVADGSIDWYAAIPAGQKAQLACLPGGTQYDNPVGVQIALSQLGLATAANQQTQITAEQGTETGVTTVNTTLGSPAQDRTIANPNPYLYGGSLQSWNALDSTIAIANPTPQAPQTIPGGPSSYAIAITPSGTATLAGAISDHFPVNPANLYTPRCAFVLPFTDANITSIQFVVTWYTSAQVFISQLFVNGTVPLNGDWVWLTGTPTAPPANAAFATIRPCINGTANIAVGDVFQVAGIMLMANVPGAPAQEGTLSTLHDRIANTGVPPLIFAQQLFSEAANTPLASGVPVNTPTVPITQPSYDGFISISSTAAGPVYVTFLLNWTQNGIVVATEAWNIICGTAASPHIIFPKGPTKGDHLQIEIVSFSAAATLVGFQMYQHSRTYRFDDWRSVQCNAFQGASAPFSNAPGLELGYRIIAAQGAGATDNIILPLFAGKVRLYANTASGLNDLGITITDAGSPGTTLGEVVYSTKSDSNGNINADLILPRSSVQIAMHNGNAAAQETRWAILIEEY